jgi:hypothetical protein
VHFELSDKHWSGERLKRVWFVYPIPFRAEIP